MRRIELDAENEVLPCKVSPCPFCYRPNIVDSIRTAEGAISHYRSLILCRHFKGLIGSEDNTLRMVFTENETINSHIPRL